MNPYASGHTPAAQASGTSGTSEWQHFFLWGLAPGRKDIDTEEVCGAGHVWTIASFGAHGRPDLR